MLFALGIAALVPGAWLTMRHWGVMKHRYRLEADFYLAHPDRLVSSELPAPWYLEGLDSVYRLPTHYLRAARQVPEDRALLDRFGTVWRYETASSWPIPPWRSSSAPAERPPLPTRADAAVAVGLAPRSPILRSPATE